MLMLLLIMIVFIADYTTTIVVSSVVGASALIALIVLLQFIRFAEMHTFLTCVSHTAHVINIGSPPVRHTLVLCRNGSTYRQTIFTAW